MVVDYLHKILTLLKIPTVQAPKNGNHYNIGVAVSIYYSFKYLNSFIAGCK